MRLAARAEGCGSIAEGEFRGSVVETINKCNIYIYYCIYYIHILIYVYISMYTYLYIDHIEIDSHTVIRI